MNLLLENAQQRAKKWLSGNIDADTKKEIERLLGQPDPKELIDNFYKDLEFGTGGLRGIMGTGSNCMNRYTVGTATQGFANYLVKSFAGKPIAVAIAHDSRNNSRAFAEIAAGIFSANGIHVHLFPELRPTPLLSFAIRYLKCQAGLVITASHNPKEYNGYKAYWTDGAQLVPPHDKNVIAEVNAIQSFDQIRFNARPEFIHTIGSEVEAAYYEEVKRLIPRQQAIQKHHDIPLVYSSIHGAGITMVPRCLELLGFTNVHVVTEQKTPDGNFPTVQSPNPEERSAMSMALEQAARENAELVMATDPDTDRVGIGIKDGHGKFFLLNGNQAFSLMMWFVLKNLSQTKGKYLAKTIVTTELIDDMARHFGVTCYNTLTGFKYIAELMREREGKEQFVAAGEESYGYMVGDFVRDKDAVSACAFFASMAAAAKDEGQTLYQWLLQMYRDFGFYKESLINLVRKGAEGEQQIKNMMKKFREQPPATLGGSRVIRLLDYQRQIETNLNTKVEQPIALPKSDVLQFYTENGNKISVRPSGTEPKIKFYVSVKAPLHDTADFDRVNAALDATLAAITKDLEV
jgi:phosphoglucomutase